MALLRCPRRSRTSAWLEAVVTATDNPTEPEAAAEQVTWRLDTDNGSMVPRSALDVLVDLNDNIASGRFGEYQPIPLGLSLIHISEPTRLGMISYAVFCLKK